MADYGYRLRHADHALREDELESLRPKGSRQALIIEPISFR